MMVKIHSKNILSTSWTRKKIMAKILNDEKFTLTSHHQPLFEYETFLCGEKQYSS